jgi:hypothetical protein
MGLRIRCEIEEIGPDLYEAAVLVVDDDGREIDRETRSVKSRKEAVEACALIGVRKAERLKAQDQDVRLEWSRPA